MRSLYYILSVGPLLFLLHPEDHTQDYEWGIGMIVSPYNVGTIVYSKPDVESDTIANVSGWEFTIYPDQEKVRGFFVGFRKYDHWGLPILSMTKDSSWAHVSVQSSDGTMTTKGWVNLRTPNTTIRIWADYLATQSMVLRTDKPLRFYSKPNNDAQLRIKLFRFHGFDEYSYILNPIRREGSWLLVELQTPFLPCGNDEAIVKDDGIRPRTVRVWIQYIDKRGRPLVQPPMMC